MHRRITAILRAMATRAFFDIPSDSIRKKETPRGTIPRGV
jgi:hypothetical protein